MEIEAGRQYLLDGKKLVTVLKPINRSKTVFSVQLGEAILTIEKEQLTIVETLDKIQEEQKGLF